MPVKNYKYSIKDKSVLPAPSPSEFLKVSQMLKSKQSFHTDKMRRVQQLVEENNFENVQYRKPAKFEQPTKSMINEMVSTSNLSLNTA